MKQVINIFKATWKDPVWSKIISVAILAIIGIVWSKLISKNNLSENNIDTRQIKSRYSSDSSQSPKSMHILAASDFIVFSNISSVEDFNINILKHGFGFVKKVTSGSEVYFYSSDKRYLAESNTLVELPDTIYYLHNVLATSVGVKTVSRSYFLDLIEQFKKQGYKKSITLKDSTGVSSQYSSSTDSTLGFSVIVNRSIFAGKSWTAYFLLFSNINPKVIGFGRKYK